MLACLHNFSCLLGSSVATVPSCVTSSLSFHFACVSFSHSARRHQYDSGHPSLPSSARLHEQRRLRAARPPRSFLLKHTHTHHPLAFPSTRPSSPADRYSPSRALRKLSSAPAVQRVARSRTRVPSWASASCPTLHRPSCATATRRRQRTTTRGSTRGSTPPPPPPTCMPRPGRSSSTCRLMSSRRGLARLTPAPTPTSTPATSYDGEPGSPQPCFGSDTPALAVLLDLASGDSIRRAAMVVCELWYVMLCCVVLTVPVFCFVAPSRVGGLYRWLDSTPAFCSVSLQKRRGEKRSRFMPFAFLLSQFYSAQIMSWLVHAWTRRTFRSIVAAVRCDRIFHPKQSVCNHCLS
jgi:hypothetical protein